MKAEQARDRALVQVDSNANGDWKRQARACVLELCISRQEFTTDAVWALLERRGARTHEPRALGAVMRHAVGEEWCAPTGRYHPSVRVDCHARPLQIWRSLISEQEIAA